MATFFENAPVPPRYMFSSEARQVVNVSHLAPPRHPRGHQEIPLGRKLWLQKLQLKRWQQWERQQWQQQRQQQMVMLQPFFNNLPDVAATHHSSTEPAPLQLQPQPQPQDQFQPQFAQQMGMGMPQPSFYNPSGPIATNNYAIGSMPLSFAPQIQPQHGPLQQGQQPQLQLHHVPTAPPPPPQQPLKRKRGRPSHASLGKITVKQKKAAARAAQREPPAPMYDFAPAAAAVSVPVPVPSNYNLYPCAAQNNSEADIPALPLAYQANVNAGNPSSSSSDDNDNTMLALDDFMATHVDLDMVGSVPDSMLMKESEDAHSSLALPLSPLPLLFPLALPPPSPHLYDGINGDNNNNNNNNMINSEPSLQEIEQNLWLRLPLFLQAEREDAATTTATTATTISPTSPSPASADPGVRMCSLNDDEAEEIAKYLNLEFADAE